MTQPVYVDPNSGAAPQPGGMVVGGAESQRGIAEEEMLTAVQDQTTKEAPTSPQEAELQRQVGVTQAQAEADGGDVKAVETPTLAATTNIQPVAEKDATPTAQWSQVDSSLTVSELKSVAKDEGVKGYSNMNESQLIEAINTKREADVSL